MTYNEYVFISEIIPTRLTLHSIVSLFYEKETNGKDFRIESKGNFIYLKTKDDIEIKDKIIKLVNKSNNKEFICKFINKNIIKNEKIKNGDNVIISGLIEYGVHLAESGKKECPFLNGKFLSKEKKNSFLKSIENSCGIKIEKISNKNFFRSNQEILSHKIQLKNLININISGIVVDNEKTNRLKYGSIFQRKSYGLGNMNIEYISNDA